jgi:hypothetical protein
MFFSMKAKKMFNKLNLKYKNKNNWLKTNLNHNIQNNKIMKKEFMIMLKI